MNSRSLSDWVQIVTAVAVIAGLGLVLWELRQAENLTRAQLSSEANLNFQQIQAAIIGDDYSETRARIFADSKLTDADLFRYDAMATSFLFSLYRISTLTNQGISDRDWRNSARQSTVCWYFGHDVGRAWLTSPAAGSNNAVLEHLRELASNCDFSGNYLKYMKEILSEARVDKDF